MAKYIRWDGTNGRYVEVVGPPGDTVTVSSNYTPTLCSDGVVLVDTSGGNVTVSLPTAVGASDCEITIKKIASANTMNVDPNGTEQIDGSSTTIPIVVQNEAITLVSDGSNWRVV